MPISQPGRPKTVFEVISEQWNSPEFNPIAPALDCHVDYVSATICSYKQVAALSPGTPEKIQTFLHRCDRIYFGSSVGGNRVDRARVELIKTTKTKILTLRYS